MGKNCLIPQNQDVGLLIIRLTFGLLFVMAGLGKFMSSMGPGLDKFSMMVGGSMILAVVIGVLELLGGLALISGFMARQAGVILSFIMVGAIVLVHGPAGDKIQILIHIALIGALLGISFIGAGNKFSLGCKK